MRFNIVAIILNLLFGILTYRHYPHWSGIFLGCSLWGMSNIVNILKGHPDDRRN